MPTTSSPVKRPGLGRRAISSHAVVTRTTTPSHAHTNSTGDLSHSHTTSSHHLHKPHHAHHRPRTHLVGGGHRHHHHHHHHNRNPSFGKNANKLQRLTSAVTAATTDSGRHHHRKKSAPATPAASPPRGGNHVRWDGALEDPHPKVSSMKKNNSSPALRRHNSSGAVVIRKSLAATHDRPRSSSGKKKTVGFELGDSDEGEWEDTTQSPESTRRGSVVLQTKDSVENAAALVDPLIFVKRPYPQIPRATSLPEPASKSFPREGHLTDEEDEQHEEQRQEQDLQGHEQRQETDQAPEPSDIASRLLSPSLSAKAPPAMSSISAMAKPATIENPISRNPSFNTLASAQDGSQRRTASSSNPPLANTPGNQTQATSSSIEGGVSRFIVNNNRANNQASFRTDSDPYTPSSFLPHYHPQTPPSPGGPVSSRKTRASPPTRPPGAEPPSRTQQKLWLQRTAALNTSPPDSHVSTTVSPSDPTFAAAHARPGSGPYDAGRGFVNGSARSGGVGQDSEAKQTRKAYEKTALELAVVRRFQAPTADSFNRLRSALQETKAPERRASLSKSVRSAPSLTLLRDGQHAGGRAQESNPEPTRQLVGRRAPELRPSAPQTYSQDPDDYSVNVSDSGELGGQRHPSQRILSTSDDTAHGNPSTDEDGESNDYSNDTEMMIRRMWDSRIVATSA